jgi:phosphodiesterase/alkaline phosphatase D-like protein
LVVEVVGSSTIYNHYFGPAHPESTTAAVAVDRVEWVWVGDLRPDGVTIAVRTVSDAPVPVSVEVQAADGRRTAADAPAVAVDANRVARVRVGGLEPSRRYDYTVVVGQRPDRGRGRGSFVTAPGVGTPASFTFAVASCARSGSNGAVYDAIAASDPLLYLITGDLHYANLSGTDPTAFIDAIGRALTSPAQAALYRAVPIDYVWDDHDYGPNNADAASASRPAARTAFRAAVPHPPLAVEDGGEPGGGAIYHAFTIGRVRFVVMDTRSERTASSMLGADQERWLLDELGRASDWGAVVLVSPDPWIAPSAAGRDDWGGSADERTRIADFIAAQRIDNLVLVAGDAHMVAIDDGTNSDFSSSGGGGFPVLQAGALDRPGNVKGGPYSEGAFAGAGQFGLVHVEDDGTQVRLRLEGKDWKSQTLVHLDVAL